MKRVIKGIKASKSVSCSGYDYSTKYATCVKQDPDADKEYFTVGEKYVILDYLENGGLLVTDNNNRRHFLNGDYVDEFFEV